MSPRPWGVFSELFFAAKFAYVIFQNYYLIFQVCALVLPACTEAKIARNKITSCLLYTPLKGWINDPNGLIRMGNTYHMFYQYNPKGDEPANISWGHAISYDLVSWTDKGLALPYNPATGELIFSGSAVYDANNTSGLGKRNKPPMIAFFTSFYSKEVKKPKRENVVEGTQSQSIALSLNNGRTWKYYGNNPVIKSPPIQYIEEFKDFRDPKVFWYEPHKKWVMVTVLSNKKKVLLYFSKNLINWEFMSDFESKYIPSPNGVWECPDLFELQVAGEYTEKWILIISTNPGGLFGGSGTHYYVGDFDGYRFVEVQPSNNNVKWLDYGSDFYAGVTFNNAEPKRILIGWINNWEYARQNYKQYKGGEGFARELSLIKENNDYKLIQTPIDTLKNYRKENVKYSKDDLTKGIEIKKNEAYELHIDVVGSDKKGLSIVLDDGKEDIYAQIVYDEKKKEISITKKNVVIDESSPKYVKHFVHYNAVKTDQMKLYIDDHTFTLFLDKGSIVFTELLISSTNRRLINRNELTDNLEVNMWRLSLDN